MNDSKIASKVRALRDLAEHPGTPEHERLAASEKLAELLEKYSIDELMLRDDRKVADKIIHRDYVRAGIYWQAEKSNVFALAEALGMTSVYFQPLGYGKQQVLVRVYGFEKDFSKFETLLASMTAQLAEAWKTFRKGFDWFDQEAWREGTDMYRFKTRRSFMVGYGNGFATRVKAGRRHAVQESGTGTELMLIDRSTQVRNHLEEKHPGLKKSQGMMLNEAYHHGRAAGARARTGESAIGKTRELQ